MNNDTIKLLNLEDVNIDLTNFSDPDEYAFDYLNGIEWFHFYFKNYIVLIIRWKVR